MRCSKSSRNVVNERGPDQAGDFSEVEPIGSENRAELDHALSAVNQIELLG